MLDGHDDPLAIAEGIAADLAKYAVIMLPLVQSARAAGISARGIWDQFALHLVGEPLMLSRIALITLWWSEANLDR